MITVKGLFGRNSLIGWEKQFDVEDPKATFWFSALDPLTKILDPRLNKEWSVLKSTCTEEYWSVLKSTHLILSWSPNDALPRSLVFLVQDACQWCSRRPEQESRKVFGESPSGNFLCQLQFWESVYMYVDLVLWRPARARVCLSPRISSPKILHSLKTWMSWRDSLTPSVHHVLRYRSKSVWKTKESRSVLLLTMLSLSTLSCRRKIVSVFALIGSLPCEGIPAELYEVANCPHSVLLWYQNNFKTHVRSSSHFSAVTD